MATTPVPVGGSVTKDPCLACESEEKLMAILALALSKLVGGSADADSSPKTLLAGNICYPCLSDKQMLQELVSLVVQHVIGKGYLTSTGDTMTDANCLLCLQPKQVRGIVLGLLSVFIASQGTPT
jgi:hypothetical protein